ncbi:MAG TPA: mandelate racemase/muconate lactonizing enzyme family protein [Firmicutes bacterium]|nr:mandelate racemase/muconate lactonizing enzyme family protein [Bacillota bacterium]
MRITDVKTFIVGNPWKNWLFAQVETDEGLTGVGEGTLNGFTLTVETAIHEMKPLIIGLDPFQVEEINLRLTRDYYSMGGQIQGAALAAMEFACWDIMGKAAGQPLYNLLGGQCRDKMRAYANGWYRGPRTPEHFYRKAKEVVAKGYTALKFDPFGSAWRTMERKELHLALEIIKAVREAVGPDVDILIEGHNRFSVYTALTIAEAMAPVQPTWFETPVPPHPISAVIEVARRSPVPIACGEDYSSREEFAQLLSADAIHIVQLEPQFLGLATAKQVCAMAHAHHAVTAPHSAQGPLCSLVCAHLNAATPNFFLHEIFDDFNEPWEKKILTQTAVVKDGYVQLPEGPGIGASLVVEEIARHPYQPGNWLPLFREGWERRESQS